MWDSLIKKKKKIMGPKKPPADADPNADGDKVEAPDINGVIDNITKALKAADAAERADKAAAAAAAEAAKPIRRSCGCGFE